ncbi:VOC family protein [Saccharospirillum sp. HFRX-1]|uniref:VOC family protein n=1 Tax=unclassified Saccharospirillum TaxID=2633430 RepID=UPI00371E17C2
MRRSLFHLAFNVTDLAEARRFYGEVLGCSEGRSTDTWVDFEFYGHQLSLHLGDVWTTRNTGQVDGVAVPMPHFGVILPLDDWQQLADRLQQAGTDFVIPPTQRYAGQPGEQHTLFFYDPFGNPIEVKGFADFAGLFER